MKLKQSLFLLLALFALQLSAQPLAQVAPEQVGMDSHRLTYADQAIENAILHKEIPGAVLAVVRNGKMAYLKAYGNRRTYPQTEPMTTGTLFDMASCSKAMSTAVCAMILTQQGKIRMQDPVSLYLPQFKNWESEDGKEKQTIRLADLLTHTSGLPSYAPAAELEKKYGSPSATGLMEYIATCKRHFKPQTAFQYSCLNFITLQHIIEQVSGQSLRDFARQNVFTPLGMNRTDYLPCQRNKNGQWVTTPGITQLPLKEIAPTEKQPNGQVLCGQVHDPLARVLNGGISGNAGLFSCAEDIALLCAALQNGGEWNGHSILSPLTVKAMRTVPRATATLGRTLGWDIFTPYASNSGDLLSPNAYGHTGYTGTSIVIDPDNDLSIILLTNAVHPADGHSVVRLRSLVANAVAGAINKEQTTKKETSQQIIMLGNSITEGGKNWAERLGNPLIRNCGVSGNNVMDLYGRLHLILPSQPAKIFLLIGVNDLSQDFTPQQIVHNIDQVVQRIRRESPTTQLYLQSVLPINESFGRWKRLEGKTSLIPEINAQLEVLAREKGIRFLNLFPLFTEKGTQTLRADLTADGLHLKEEGYRIWVEALKKEL